MECNKCKGDFSHIQWKSKETYEGIDLHHNPPEFISDYLKEKWSGEFYNLCRKHHKELHKEILKILNKNSSSLKFINSEYWICKRMSLNEMKQAQKEIYIFTKEWIGGGNGNGRNN